MAKIVVATYPYRTFAIPIESSWTGETLQMGHLPTGLIEIEKSLEVGYEYEAVIIDKNIRVSIISRIVGCSIVHKIRNAQLSAVSLSSQNRKQSEYEKIENALHRDTSFPFLNNIG